MLVIERTKLDNVLAISELSALSEFACSGSKFEVGEVERMLSNPDEYWSLVAKEDGKVIGYGFWRIVQDELHSVEIAIKEEFRGIGISREIMEHLADEARERGFKQIRLLPRLNNIPFLRMHRELGYKARSVIRGSTPGDDRIEICLEL